MTNRKYFSKTFKLFAAVLTLGILFSVSVSALPSHTDFISDGAVILGEEAEEQIKSASDELYKSRNTRIAVCTVLNTGDRDIRTFAAEIFKEWNIKNGVLIVLVTEDDTFYAVQSNSICDVLTGAKLSEILNSTLEPAFVSKDYSAGTLATVNALSVFLSNNLPEDFGAKDKATIPPVLSFILKAVIIIAILAALGYAALIIAERRKAARRREEMEARRRMVSSGFAPQERRDARAGRQPSRPDGYQAARRPATQRPAPARNAQNAQMQRAGTPRPAAQNAPARNNQSASRRAVRSPRDTERYDASTAATIQINAADIRAAKQAQNNKNYRR